MVEVSRDDLAVHVRFSLLQQGSGRISMRTIFFGSREESGGHVVAENICKSEEYLGNFSSSTNKTLSTIRLKWLNENAITKQPIIDSLLCVKLYGNSFLCVAFIFYDRLSLLELAFSLIRMMHFFTGLGSEAGTLPRFQ